MNSADMNAYIQGNYTILYYILKYLISAFEVFNFFLRARHTIVSSPANSYLTY